jgi:peptidoglycan/LPS O-acetylase OafA/YrhL
MGMLITLATLLLCLIIVLCAGTLLYYLVLSPYGASRVEEIRRLRQEGLAVNQAGEE